MIQPSMHQHSHTSKDTLNDLLNKYDTRKKSGIHEGMDETVAMSMKDLSSCTCMNTLLNIEKLFVCMLVTYPLRFFNRHTDILRSWDYRSRLPSFQSLDLRRENALSGNCNVSLLVILFRGTRRGRALAIEQVKSQARECHVGMLPGDEIEIKVGKKSVMRCGKK
jgi:hypothetical protein